MAEDLLKIFEQAGLELYFRYRVDVTYHFYMLKKNTIIVLYIYIKNGNII